MSDDAADSNTVISTWEQAEQEHADAVCAIYLSDNNVMKHLVHNAAVQQKNTAQDNDINVQTAEEKTEQW